MYGIMAASHDFTNMWAEEFPDDREDYSLITESKYYDIDELNQLMIDSHLDSKLSIFNLNARSLVGHRDEFRSILSSLTHDFDVISLGESWLSNDLEAMVSLENYDHFTQHGPCEYS